MRPLHDLRCLLATLAVSAFPGDVMAVIRLGLAYSLGRGGPPVVLHPRRLNGSPVSLRPGTRDLVTYHDAFAVGYHCMGHGPAEPRTIIDMGANIGLVSADYAVAFPHARIVSVEMDQGNFEALERNTLQFGPRLSRVRAAVWTHDDGIAYAGGAEDAFSVASEAPPGTSLSLSRRASPRRVFSRCSTTPTMASIS